VDHIVLLGFPRNGGTGMSTTQKFFMDVISKEVAGRRGLGVKLPPRYPVKSYSWMHRLCIVLKTKFLNNFYFVKFKKKIFLFCGMFLFILLVPK